MLLSAVLCLSILISVHGHLDERVNKEIVKEEMVKRLGKCLDEFNLTFEDFVKTREPDLDPCFMACYFKDIKLMNDQGMLEVDEAVELESSREDTPIRMIKAFPELCKDVNEKEVTDGDKGCERAKLINECLKEVIRKMHTATISIRRS